MRHKLLIIALLLALPLGRPAAAEPARVKVADPYIELHTGPGRGYPVFYVVERGEQVQLLERRTDWIKVRGAKDVEGWVSVDQLQRTLTPGGEPVRIAEPGEKDYLNRKWEFGVSGGRLEGANAFSVYGAWLFTRNLSLQIGVTEALGQYSDNLLADVDLVHQTFPEWWISPFFALGTGVIRTSPSATLVATKDRVDQTAHVAVGARMHLARQFELRAEYRNYIVLTSRNENEELNLWQAGFAFFF